MLNTHAYLKEHGRKVTAEEATNIINNNQGIITRPGYVHFKGHYLAYGPIPGSFRGGDTSNIVSLLKDNEELLYQVTLKDLVILKGFYPDPFLLNVLVRVQSDWQDYSINVDELVKYCIESPYTKEDLLGMQRSDIWKNYFSNHKNG